jgi:glucose/arabinose dehydrogenase
VAFGMRNEVGMAIDSRGRMWSVENGRDQLFDNRFGGDIHYDNPSEKLNRVGGSGLTYFGYPQCWPEGDLPGGSGPGTLHADQEVPPELLQNDAWCQNRGNVQPPAAVMPAHWAPLGITEYTGDLLPAAYRGDLFITSHGSLNREIGQVGRLVARAHLLADGTVASIEPIVGQRGSNGLLRQGQWLIRPVDIQQGPDGALYFSDDLGGSVFRIAAQVGAADGGQDPSDGGTPPSKLRSPGERQIRVLLRRRRPWHRRGSRDPACPRDQTRRWTLAEAALKLRLTTGWLSTATARCERL